MSLLCPALVNMMVRCLYSTFHALLPLLLYHFSAALPLLMFFGPHTMPVSPVCFLCQQVLLNLTLYSNIAFFLFFFFFFHCWNTPTVFDQGKDAKGFDYAKEQPFGTLHLIFEFDVLNCSRRSREVPEWETHLHSLAPNSIRSKAHLWENRTELW